jgi:hypothetical protein
MADNRRAIVVTVASDQFEQVSSTWKQLPIKQSDKLGMSKVVESMFDDILLLRSRGYSWQDICDLIEKDFNAKLAPITLQQHVRKIRKVKTAVAKGAKRQSQRSAATVAPSTAATVARPVEVRSQLPSAFKQRSQPTNASTEVVESLTFQSEESKASEQATNLHSTKPTEVVEIDQKNSSSEDNAETTNGKAQKVRSRTSDEAPQEKSRFNTLIMDHSKL